MGEAYPFPWVQPQVTFTLSIFVLFLLLRDIELRNRLLALQLFLCLQRDVITQKGFQFSQERFETVLRLNSALRWSHLLLVGPFASHSATWSIRPLAHLIQRYYGKIEKMCTSMCVSHTESRVMEVLCVCVDTDRDSVITLNLLSCKGQSNPFTLLHTFHQVLKELSSGCWWFYTLC